MATILYLVHRLPYPPDKGEKARAVIEKGRYKLDAAHGPVIGINKVEIRSDRKTGKMVPLPGGRPGEETDEVVESLPARYHTDSKNHVTVKPGENHEPFRVLSK